MCRAPHSLVEFIILILLLILIPHCKVSRATLQGNGSGAGCESIMIMVMIMSFCDGHEYPSWIRSFRHRTQNLTHLLHVLKGKRS